MGRYYYPWADIGAAGVPTVIYVPTISEGTYRLVALSATAITDANCLKAYKWALGMGYLA